MALCIRGHIPGVCGHGSAELAVCVAVVGAVFVEGLHSGEPGGALCTAYVFVALCRFWCGRHQGSTPRRTVCVITSRAIVVQAASIELPLVAAPQRPGQVVPNLASAVWVHQDIQTPAVLCEEGDQRADVLRGYEGGPFGGDERAGRGGVVVHNAERRVHSVCALAVVARSGGVDVECRDKLLLQTHRLRHACIMLVPVQHVNVVRIVLNRLRTPDGLIARHSCLPQ